MSALANDLAGMLDQYRAKLARVSAGATDALAREAALLEDRIIELVTKGSGRLSVQAVREIRAELRSMSITSGRKAARQLVRHMHPAMEVAADRTAATTEYLLRRIKHPGLGRTIQAMDSWRKRIDQRALISTEYYADRWAKAWDADWTRKTDLIGRQLAQSALRREGWEKAAERIWPDLAKLQAEGRPIAGLMHPEAFGRAFARTRLSELAHEEGIREAQAVGLVLFTNIGVSDDRQSPICYLACQQPPMTIEQWRNWRRDSSDPSNDGGLPKRHVFNCRDDLVGVPQSMAKDDFRQPSQVWTEASAEAELQQAAA